MSSTFPTTEKALKVPPLENGDCLTRAEFERHYTAMPDLKKAELIEGVVYVASPLRFDNHGKPHFDLITWLGVYCAGTLGVNGGDNATTRLDLDNEPQPDVQLRIANGGQSTIGNDGYVEGPPELIAEVAASSVSYDLRQKLQVYRRNRVQEYLVWRVDDCQIDWFRLKAEEYVLLEPDAAGVVRSEVFPGLWLARQAMLEGNLAVVLATLQAGLATAAHADFVKQLSKPS